MRLKQKMMTFTDESNYQVIIDERIYYNALSDFLDAGRSQGYYNALSELIDLCPLYERPMLFQALKQVSSEIDK